MKILHTESHEDAESAEKKDMQRLASERFNMRGQIQMEYA
jgi:hypothetical protein